MSFAKGAAVFNSCNKAGAVGHFTHHLERYPCDWNALMWRAEAYIILGQQQNAVKDIDRAIEVSRGVQRKLAEAEKKKYATNKANIADCIGTYKQITVEHPDCWRAWKNLGHLQKQSGDTDSAVKSLSNAIDIATEHGESKDPGVCWAQLHLGLIWSNRGKLDSAAGYFKGAIESSPTHTVSHISLCRNNLTQGNFSEARQNFTTAIGLNPELVKETLGSDTFDGYFLSFQQQSLAAKSENKQPTQHASTASTFLHETQLQVLGDTSKTKQHASRTPTSSKVGRNYSADAAGARGGNGGGGGGGSSGDDDDEYSGKDVSQIWKQLQKESPSVKLYKKHKYVQSKCGKFWYSKDTAGHAGAAFKRYDDTRSSLRFRDSLDENMRPMTNKHESREGTVIYKNDMIGVK